MNFKRTVTTPKNVEGGFLISEDEKLVAVWSEGSEKDGRIYIRYANLDSLESLFDANFDIEA